MSKEVRLNDKIWFGKYKGTSIKELLDLDRGFLDGMVIRGKITFHKNVNDYLNRGRRTKEKISYRPAGSDYENYWWDPSPAGSYGYATTSIPSDSNVETTTSDTNQGEVSSAVFSTPNIFNQ